MQIKLRYYQSDGEEALRNNIRQGIKNQILCLPTGSGKTISAAHLISECYSKGKRAIFVCDRIALINQTSEVFDIYGIPHGVIQADHWRYRPYERIQIASAQTLARREWPEADLIVIDECHCVQETVKNRIGKRNTVTIGLTATPFTKGLGKIYDSVVTVTTMNKLTEQKFIVPFRVFAASEPDMKGVKVVAGEWSEDEAAKKCIPIVGDCVSEYLKHGENKKFIAFGCNIAHCEELNRQFLAAGIMTELYTCHTPDTARAVMMTEFHKSNSYIRGLISVSALSKGLDVPDVEIIIMARPLRSSLAEHIQILGRGLRPSNGKTYCLVLDHAGNMLRFWEDMHDFFEHGVTELDDGKPKKKDKAKPKIKKPIKCPACFHVHDPTPACPACGIVYEKRSKTEHINGALTEIDSGRRIKIIERNPSQVFAEIKQISIDYQWKKGRAEHVFKNCFGFWPNAYQNVDPLPASEQTIHEIRRQNMIYIKTIKNKERRVS